MRLVKIKNRYLFDSDNPNGVHTYAVYFDRKSKRYRAVALTHLYVKDKNRFKQVRRGNIKIEKFNEFDVPSGVQNYYYSQRKSGGKIDLRDTSNVEFLSKRYMNKRQSDRIKNFAVRDWNNPKDKYSGKKGKKKTATQL